MRTYCIPQGTLLSATWWLACEGNPKGADICKHTTDSLCSTVETNIVKQLYSNWKVKEESDFKDGNILEICGPGMWTCFHFWMWHFKLVKGVNHQFSGHEFEQTPEDEEQQGSLECCSPWGCKESDTAEWLNNKKGRKFYFIYLIIIKEAEKRE